MTTSIDPSVDELLLLQENQYQMPNYLLKNIKPIGAERKVGQPTRTSTQFFASAQRLAYPMHIDFAPKDPQDFKSFEIPPPTEPTATSISEHFHFSPLDELECSTCPSFSNYSSSSASSTSGSSTAPSPRPASHSLDNYIYQRQISTSLVNQQKFNQSISTTGKIRPSFCATHTYPTSRFYVPQQYNRNSFLNICQQTRSTPPVFAAPSQCTRERFQVNSIGRPILRTNTSYHLSFKVRR